MKKSGFLLLVVALFLITTSVSADGLSYPFNPMISVQYADMGSGEIKIDVQEEVAYAERVGEIDVALSAYSIQSIDVSSNTVNDLSILVGHINELKAAPGLYSGGFAVRLKYPYLATGQNSDISPM